MRMAVEQILEQRRPAALMPADEHGAEQPAERGSAFGAARLEASELARLAYRRRGVFGKIGQQLRAGRYAASPGQQPRDRRLGLDPIAPSRHGASLYVAS